jgi:beta-N-acetylhexosaminidase
MSPQALRRRVGQFLIAGFGGHQIPVELKSLAREFSLGGVILFARNIADPEQLAELAAEAARLVPDIPLWVSLDQEGGRVARLQAPFTIWPPMAALGRSGDTGLAERFGRALAIELRAVGISLDYAPVLDIHSNPKNSVIGDRALSERAEDVARLGAAIIRGLQGEGIAACGKHFPGHGDTTADSHVDLPIVEHPPDRLRAVELVPFKAAIAAEVATMMTAHVLIPALDEERPATLSKRIVGAWLRDELQYEGVILSDDLEMKAIADRYSVPSAAVLAVEAGCDGLLVCGVNGPNGPDHDLQAAVCEALVHAVEEEHLRGAHVEDALARHQRAKERFLGTTVATRPPTAKALRQILERDAHRALADEIARHL